MADRYFKADDVLFYLYESAEGLHDSPQFVDLLKCCVEGINCLPAADVVERKKGEWEFDGHGVVCSACGQFIGIEPHILEWNTLEKWWMNFCPNCGADMRGESND